MVGRIPPGNIRPNKIRWKKSMATTLLLQMKKVWSGVTHTSKEQMVANGATMELLVILIIS